MAHGNQGFRICAGARWKLALAGDFRIVRSSWVSRLMRLSLKAASGAIHLWRRARELHVLPSNVGMTDVFRWFTFKRCVLRSHRELAAQWCSDIGGQATSSSSARVGGAVRLRSAAWPMAITLAALRFGCGGTNIVADGAQADYGDAIAGVRDAELIQAAHYASIGSTRAAASL